MRPLTERLLSEFTTRSAERGWRREFVEEDDCAGFSRPAGPELVADLIIDLAV